jgi:peptide/nickel transport system substrate-binding protein
MIAETKIRERRMSEFQVSRRQFVASSAIMSTLATLGINPAAAWAEGNVLKIRMVGDIQVLDPGYMIGGAETTIQYATLPRLAVPIRDASGNFTWQPSEYVEKIEQTDDLHIAFTLKQGFKWSGDLGEVTADDVKYSLERMLKSDWNSRWPTLDHVDVTDKYSGTIVLKSPYVAVFLIGVASESGTILSKAAVSKLKDEKFTTELPCTCGPYVMTEWTPKQKVVLKADPNWTGTKPAFPEVHIMDVEENKPAELAYEAGEIDITSVTPDTAARYEKAMPPKSKLEQLPGPLYTWMGINTDYPALKDIRVRKAIQRAVDVDSLLQAAYAGVAPKAFGVVPPGILGHRPAAKFSFNPDEARALLKDAGVSNLTLDLKTLPDQDRVTMAQIIQANLGDVGIKVNIVPVDSGPFWNLGLEKKGDDWKTLQLWIMQFRCSPDPSDAIQWFKKDQVGVWNWERWSDPEFEDLWTKGLAERDTKKREQIYLRMQEIMEDTGAYVWLTFTPWFYIHRDSIVPDFDTGGEMLVNRFKSA